MAMSVLCTSCGLNVPCMPRLLKPCMLAYSVPGRPATTASASKSKLAMMSGLRPAAFATWIALSGIVPGTWYFGSTKIAPYSARPWRKRTTSPTSFASWLGT